ncbi:MAG: putative pterin-4-alpha-carbinolamine dehydratase [Parcubacteria bacterium OLB19]|nr:MAG: putative pterin-4-alpha-carbinolamine dehydratase [Parcubacteria bacterium OLB19]
MKLTEQKCEACEGGVIPFSLREIEILLQQVPGWSLFADQKTIFKKYKFKDFKEALAFVNRVGNIAEEEGHHPDIHLVNFREVEIHLRTHAIDGVSNNDFIVAAKIDSEL